MTAMTLGLVGYSTRALAAAVVDSGFQAVALDAFCDLDTRQLATCRSVDRWPEQILPLAAEVHCDAWLLAGGLENHARIVEGLSSLAPVLGPTRRQLRQLRSLPALAELVAGIDGMNCPETALSPQRFAGRRYLFKPFRGAGGLGVHEQEAQGVIPRGGADSSRRGYWQAWVPGRVLGITCIIQQAGQSQMADGDQPRASVCGVTESLQPADWPGPQPFVYRGSLGPVDLTPNQKQAIIALATRVGERLGYRGWLQADFIESPDGQLWLLEFNPRWTAGMELLQACLPRECQPLTAHLHSWGISSPRTANPQKACLAANPTTMHGPVRGASATRAGYMVAKAIVYATGSSRLADDMLSRLPLFQQQQQRWNNDLWWDIADIPAANPSGQPLQVAAGQPLLTLRCGSVSGVYYPREVWLAVLHQARAAIAELLQLA